MSLVSIAKALDGHPWTELERLGAIKKFLPFVDGQYLLSDGSTVKKAFVGEQRVVQHVDDGIHVRAAIRSVNQDVRRI